MYKISIIIPIFNVEKYLKRALDSIINQTMDFRDIEVIMIDDCSTDNSKNIIEEYSNKYSNFIGIYHEKNSGCAAIPRNTGLKVASGDYIMFLDPDDEYLSDCCEKLYDTILKYDADIAFGRYVEVYDNRKTVKKSYSVYGDEIISEYSNMEFEAKSEPNRLTKLISNFIDTIFYGGQLNRKSLEIVDTMYVHEINQEPILLKLSTPVWNKIYKKELIFDNDIIFPPFKLGEDLSFVLQTFFKANGIVFLNNFFACNYSIREDGNQSVSKSIDFKLLDDGVDNLIFCSNFIKKFSNDIKDFALIPNIKYWFYSWEKSHLTFDENKYLIKKLYDLKEILNYNFKIKLLLSLIINYIKFSLIF